MNEQEVWLKFKKGSEPAFAYLYKVYAPVMFRYGCKLTNDRNLIKDCLQQVFYNMWKGRENLGNPASVRNYLLKAIRTEVFKKSGRENKFKTISNDYDLTVAASYESDLIEEQTSESMRKKISYLLTKLPDRQREVIFLKYYSNLSYKEIAVVMNIGQESVYKLTYKSIEKLQQLLKK